MEVTNTRMSYTLFYIAIFCDILQSMNIWINSISELAWNIKFVSAIMCMPLLVQKIMEIRHFFTYIIFVICILSITQLGGDIKILGLVVMFVPVLTLFCIDDYERKKLLSKINSFFGILLILSIATYALAVLSIIPPFLGIFEYDDYGSFLNYLFYVHSLDLANYEYRFSACFIEPGHLAMILSFFLYANKYDFRKWYNWIFLIALGLSLSLAGYILAILGYTFILFLKDRSRLKSSIKYVIIIFFLWYGATVYNNGRNFVNELIIERLTYDEEKGISGNNRTNETTDIYYSRLSIKDYLIGKNDVKYLEREGVSRGAGYKIYICRYGLLTALLWLFFYIAIIYHRHSKYNWLFLLVIIFAFIQRAYPWWISWIVPYFCAYYDDIDKLYEAKTRMDEKYLFSNRF